MDRRDQLFDIQILDIRVEQERAETVLPQAEQGVRPSHHLSCWQRLRPGPFEKFFPEFRTGTDHQNLPRPFLTNIGPAADILKLLVLHRLFCATANL